MTPSTRNVEIGKFIETEVISQLLRAGGAEGGTDCYWIQGFLQGDKHEVLKW